MSSCFEINSAGSFSCSYSRVRQLLSAFPWVQSYIFAPHYPETKAERRVLQVLLVISAAILIALIVYYFLNPRSIIGDAFVNNPNGGPAEFPPPGTSPFYIKPITALFGAGIVFSYCAFSLILNFARTKVPRSIRALLLVAAVLALGIGIYEVLFNFALWTALLVSGAPPDTYVNAHPVASVKTNLVYATKITVLWVIAGTFAVTTLSKSLEDKEKN